MIWPITCMSAQAYHPLMFDQVINTIRNCTLNILLSHYKLHNAHHRLLQWTAQKRLNKRKECVSVCVCVCVHARACMSMHVCISTQLCTSILHTFHQLLGLLSCTLDTTTPHMPELSAHCCGCAASTPLSQLGGSGFRPQRTDMLPWFSQFSLVHLGNCQENTSTHAMNTSLLIPSNSLFIYPLSQYDSLRCQLHW